MLFRTDFTAAQDEPGEMLLKLRRRSSWQPAFRIGLAHEVSHRMGVEVRTGYQLGKAVYHLIEERTGLPILKKKAIVPYSGFELAVGLQFYPFR